MKGYTATELSTLVYAIRRTIEQERDKGIKQQLKRLEEKVTKSLSERIQTDTIQGIKS